MFEEALAWIGLWFLTVLLWHVFVVASARAYVAYYGHVYTTRMRLEDFPQVIHVMWDTTVMGYLSKVV